MNEKELKAMADKLRNARHDVGELFVEHDLDVGEVVTILMFMLVETSCEAEIETLKVISSLVDGFRAYEKLTEAEAEAEEEKENVQWLN